jgi:hypothetical protein
VKTFPQPVPQTPQHLKASIEIIRKWLLEQQHANNEQVKQVIGLLDKSYLQQIKLPKGSPTSCKHWFCKQCGCCWGEHCKEGELTGFSVTINYENREILWPNSFGLKIEHTRTNHAKDHKTLKCHGFLFHNKKMY